MTHMVMTRCPQTGQDIETGIICDLRTFNGLADRPARLQCPACSLEHEWSVKEAWLAAKAYTQTTDADPVRRGRVDSAGS